MGNRLSITRNFESSIRDTNRKSSGLVERCFETKFQVNSILPLTASYEVSLRTEIQFYLALDCVRMFFESIEDMNSLQ